MLPETLIRVYNGLVLSYASCAIEFLLTAAIFLSFLYNIAWHAELIYFSKLVSHDATNSLNPCDHHMKCKNLVYITLTSQWTPWHIKSPASRLFTQPFIQTQIKENIAAPRHWPLNSPGPVNSPHKGPVTRKMFPSDDVIMVTQVIMAVVWSRCCALSLVSVTLS